MILAGEEYGAIARVALAGVTQAKISQRSVSDAVLTAVAPGVRAEFFATEIKS